LTFFYNLITIFLEKKSKIILFVSGGFLPDETNNIIENSYNELVSLGYTIILRPYPGEYPVIENRTVV